VPVQFAPLSLGDALDALVRQGVPPERAEHFARWGRGAPGTALLLAERGGDDLRALFAAVAVGELAPHEAARAVWDLPGEYPGDKVPVVARGRARFVCDFALDVAGDLLRASVGSEPRDLAHGDLAARVGATEPVARRLADALVEARADVDRNLAPEAAVERLMLAFADLAPLRSPPAASARVR
jgi:hypothetical protein